jgi:hypothetical protein
MVVNGGNIDASGSSDYGGQRLGVEEEELKERIRELREELNVGGTRLIFLRRKYTYPRTDK